MENTQTQYTLNYPINVHVTHVIEQDALQQNQSFSGTHRGKEVKIKHNDPQFKEKFEQLVLENRQDQIKVIVKNTIHTSADGEQVILEQSPASQTTRLTVIPQVYLKGKSEQFGLKRKIIVRIEDTAPPEVLKKHCLSSQFKCYPFINSKSTGWLPKQSKQTTEISLFGTTFAGDDSGLPPVSLNAPEEAEEPPLESSYCCKKRYICKTEVIPSGSITADYLRIRQENKEAANPVFIGDRIVGCQFSLNGERAFTLNFVRQEIKSLAQMSAQVVKDTVERGLKENPFTEEDHPFHEKNRCIAFLFPRQIMHYLNERMESSVLLPHFADTRICLYDQYFPLLDNATTKKEKLNKEFLFMSSACVGSPIEKPEAYIQQLKSASYWLSID